MRRRYFKPVIAPTITAYDTHEYRRQIEQIEPFAQRIHIDLMDGEFAPTVSPHLDYVWWPRNLKADIHLMYKNPMDHIDKLIHLKPHMVIVHSEAAFDHMHFSARLHRNHIKTGLAILNETPVQWVDNSMHSFDQILIFSGNLGHHGGTADLDLLDKVRYIRQHHPEVEIAWDGGINDKNAPKLVEAGVSVLNTGGFIQKANNPQKAYDKIVVSLKTKKS